MIGLILFLATQDPALPAARPCTAAEIAELTRATDEPYGLACRAVLTPDARVTRRIVIEGAEASGAGIDCRGAAAYVVKSKQLGTPGSHAARLGWRAPHRRRLPGHGRREVSVLFATRPDPQAVDLSVSGWVDP